MLQNEPPLKKSNGSCVDKSKNNSTISTKNSHEQLICKTPQNTPPGTLKKIKSEQTTSEKNVKQSANKFNYLLFLGAFQVFFGLLMVVCGVLVVIYKSHLGIIGGGIWGGFLAVITGFIGIVSTSKDWCVLKAAPQRIALIIFLIMSLISLAISQLVLVIAATGLARDFRDDENEQEKISSGFNSKVLQDNYFQLFSNVGLIIACGLECICAATCAYKTAKNVCPCFNNLENISQDCIPEASKDQFISSWLGKHNSQQPFFVVTGPPSSTKSNKVYGPLPMHVFTFPPRMLQPPQQVVGYPLIPAPLGPIPSPLIAQDPKEMIFVRHPKKHIHQPSSFYPNKPSKHQLHKHVRKQKKISKPDQPKGVTEEELAKTYTGLDRTIAEEFIQISESQNNSLCSSSVCNEGCVNECNCPSTSTSSSSSRFISEL